MTKSAIERVHELAVEIARANLRIAQLEEALHRISIQTTDMPDAYNDATEWYRGLVFEHIGIATRALKGGA